MSYFLTFAAGVIFGAMMMAIVSIGKDDVNHD